MQDTVILLHGIGRTRRCMDKLARFLEKDGYHTLNIRYPSCSQPLEALVQHLHQLVGKPIGESNTTIHFVGYSMGGLLIRAYLHAYRPERLGRVVMLGTPNHGSEVADMLRENLLYRWVYGPAGQQLITEQQAFRQILGNVNYELGIIAGNKPMDGVISSRIIRTAHDGRVSVESTKLHGMKDHIILPVNHTFLPSYPPAITQTHAFLKHGAFSHVR